MAETDVLDELFGPEKPDVEEPAQEAGAQEVKETPKAESAAGEKKDTPTPGDADTDGKKDHPEGGDGKEASPDKPASDDKGRDYEREKKGLLTAKMEEVKKRQAAEAERDELKRRFDAIMDRLNKKDEPPKPQEETPAPKPKKVSVDIDDEGNGYVSEDSLRDLLQDYIKTQTGPLADNLQAILKKNELDEHQKRQTTALERSISDVIAEQPDDFKEAHKRLMPAWQFINSNLDKRYPDVDSMMSAMEQNGIADAFRDQFPGVDIGDVAMAFASKYNFKRALRQFVQKDQPQEEVVEEEQPKPDERDKVKTLKKLSEKPQSLAAVRSQQAPKRKLNDLAKMSFEEKMALDDKTIEAMERDMFAE